MPCFITTERNQTLESIQTSSQVCSPTTSHTNSAMTLPQDSFVLVRIIHPAYMMPHPFHHETGTKKCDTSGSQVFRIPESPLRLWQCWLGDTKVYLHFSHYRDKTSRKHNKQHI